MASWFYTCHMGPEPWASPSRPHGLQEGALGSSRAPACTAHTQTVPDTPAPRPTRHWLGRSPCFSAILVLTWLPRRGGIASPLKASAARPGLQMSSCPGFYPPLGHMCIRWWDAAAEATMPTFLWPLLLLLSCSAPLAHSPDVHTSVESPRAPAPLALPAWTTCEYRSSSVTMALA